MKYVAFERGFHDAYVAHVLPVALSADTRGIVAMDKKGQAVGVCLIDGWTPNACTVHLAIQKPMCLRKLFHEAARYIFMDCGKQMAIGLVTADNVKALRLNKNVGFKEIYRIEDGHAPGVDQVIMRLNKADCRFLHADHRLQEVA